LPNGQLLAAFRRATDPTTRKNVGGVFFRGSKDIDPWKQVMSPQVDLVPPECAGNDVGFCGPRGGRVTAAGNQVAVHSDCMLFLAPLDKLAAASDLAHADAQWMQAQRSSDGKPKDFLKAGAFVVNASNRICSNSLSGYAMSVAISPADPNRILIGGSNPW